MNDRTKTSLPRIGLIVFPMRNPFEECGQMFTSKFINVLAPLSSRLSIITGNYFPSDIPDNVEIVNISSPIIKMFNESIISKMHRLLTTQFWISTKLIQLSKQIDIVILFFGANLLFLPMLIAHIQGKKILIVVTGSDSQSIEMMYPGVLGRFFSSIFRRIEHFNYNLTDKIIVYSQSMVNAMNLNRYREKIITEGYRGYIDAEHFGIIKNIAVRKNIIGYIGRLSGEKGVINLVKAIPNILRKNDSIKFLIIGEGELKNDMVQKLNEDGCMNNVKFEGWIPNQNIPTYLNKMKFLVLPSYTEGLPGVILEAMACGSIVIANSVGGVPDIIKDGETGFLLKNNSPEHITSKILDIIKYPQLNEIQINARKFVEANYTHRKAVERYEKILNSIEDE